MTAPPIAVLINTIERLVFELTEDVTSIGRDSKCNISISDQLLSRFHAEIQKLADGKYIIKDMSSSYGTYVEGERIAERILHDGDEIIVGTTCFRFQLSNQNSVNYESASGVATDIVELYPGIDSVWEDGKNFLEAFSDEDGLGRFFHPIQEGARLPSGLTPGALLSVRIRFLDRDVAFHIHALVREYRTEGESKGLLLEFLKEEKDRQELVLLCAKGESIPYFRRREERFPCRLNVHVEMSKGKNLNSVASNISNSGIYLVPEHKMKLKMLVQLLIYFPNQTTVGVKGRVVSIVPEGPQQGMGIEFIFSSSKQRDEMAEQIAILRKAQS